MSGDHGSETNSELGARIRELRKSRAITLRALADRLGVSAATVSGIENGNTGVSASRLARIAEILDSPIQAFLAQPESASAAREVPRYSAVSDWRSYPPLNLEQPLAAALSAIIEVGYHGANMRTIAKRAGLSVPGVYHYYPSKQSMLVELLDSAVSDLLHRSSLALAEGTDAVSRFRLLVECLALYHAMRPEMGFLGASEMRSLEPAARTSIAAMRTSQQRMLDDAVDAACMDGVFTTDHPRAASRAIVTMCTGLVQWFRPEGPTSPQATAAELVEFALGVVGYQGSHHTAVNIDRLARGDFEPSP